MSKIKFQDVYRDAIQSLFGTNPSAQEIIDSYPTAHLTGTHAIQTGGGTFFDLFAKRGRNEWEEVEKLISHFRDLGVRQSALIRGDFLFGYDPQPYDVIRELVFDYAAMGMNVLQNFHGLNDARCLVGVAKAVAEARDAGHNIIAQGTICIEDNPNVTVAKCLIFADELVALGHNGFYLKSASGRLSPYFVYELVSNLYRRFPDHDVTIHAHSTFGEAPACYMAATLAAIEQDRDITMDVQHPALAGSTAQPSMNKMADLIRNYPDERVSSKTPKLNVDAIKASMFSLYGLRFRYREFEAAYDPQLVDAMYAARTPGGASATLRSIPGLVDNLGRLLGTAGNHADWNQIQIAIYRMQATILQDLGQPTQVTPYAANTTGQAALSLSHQLEGREKYHSLYPGIADYLAGRHGWVPPSANPSLVKKALCQLGLKKPEDYTGAMDRVDIMPKTKDLLVAAGVAHPTTRQKISASILKDTGPFRAISHVVACAEGRNVPRPLPDQPFYAQSPQPMPRADGAGVNRDVRDAVNTIGGYSRLQEIAERALHIKQLIDRRYIFPAGEEDLEQDWLESNILRLKLILADIPTKLAEANFSEGQKMVMLEHNHPNSIHLAIKDAVDHKGAGLYDFMVRLIGVES